MNLSGGLLSLRYRSADPMDRAIITLKPTATARRSRGLIPTEIFTRFAATAAARQEIRSPCRPRPGLARIKEVVITFGPESKGRPIDLTITHLAVSPISPAGG